MNNALVIAWVTTCFAVAVLCFCAAVAPACGSMDLTELARIRAITCPSVCAAYADVVDAGVEVTPEDEALIGVCEC